MKIRSGFLRIALVVGFGLAIFAPHAAGDRPRVASITILHTNDVHGHLLPFSYPEPSETDSPIARMPAIRNIGGMARIATLARRIHEETGGAALLLDAGDILDGTPFSVFYHGLADIEVMNAVGYDAMTTGNHEYNLDYEQFQELIRAADFPVICANARFADGEGGDLHPRLLLERGGLQIGLFGLTTVASRSYPACRERIEILDPIPVARAEVAELRRSGADLVVALSHLGFSGDQVLADSVPGIDLIIGGHSHTRLADPRVVPHSGPEGEGNGITLIAQAYQWAGELGRVDLTLSREGGSRYVPVSHRGELIPVTADIEEDREVAAIVERLYEPMVPVYGERLGEATGDFANVGFERATVNLVADVIRRVTGCDVALQNYGGVRESIFAGPVRMWEIASMLPFENRIVILEMTGDRLREGLESDQEFFGFSGMRVVWKDRAPVEIEIDGHSLDEGRLYSVAMVDYVQRKCFGDRPPVRDTGLLLRDAVADHVREVGTIRPVLDGRTRIAAQ